MVLVSETLSRSLGHKSPLEWDWHSQEIEASEIPSPSRHMGIQQEVVTQKRTLT